MAEIERTIDLRCLSCRGEFASADYPELQACPSCGNTGVPADPREDRDWTLTAWEWRVLATLFVVWADVCRRGEGDRAKAEHLWLTAGTLWERVMRTTLDDDAGFPLAAEDYIRSAEGSESRTVRLTPHELRILTIWASNAVNATKEGTAALTDSDLEPALIKLNDQAGRDVPLTFEDEIEQLRKQFPSVQVKYGGGQA